MENLLSIMISIFYIVCMWTIFEKSGQSGWKSLIPIYNFYTFLKIAKMSGWCILLLFIPVVNIIFLAVYTTNLAKVFNKSTAFGIGLLFLPIIFFPILAFGDSVYQY